MIDWSNGRGRLVYLPAKRCLDLLGAALGLVVLSPVLVGVAAAVRTHLGSPILYQQIRLGRNGKPFRIFKFRTMTDKRDSSGNPAPDTIRLIGLGRFLRRTSLDELPELFNVLKGEMSLVGPRPLLMRYNRYYTEEEQVRFGARPGITGLAQVSGRNDLDWTGRLSLDVYYVGHMSPWIDMRIVLLTLKQVLTHEGIREDPGVAMSDFDVERKREPAAHPPAANTVGIVGTIRRAHRSDCRNIYRMKQDAFQSYLLYSVYQTRASMRYLRKLLTQPADDSANHFYLLECNGIPMGYYHAVASTERLHLNYIAVDHDVRGQGVGDELLRHYESLGRVLKLERLTVDVYESNPTALEWYLSKGYARIGEKYQLRLAIPKNAKIGLGLLSFSSEDWERARKREAYWGFSRLECKFGGASITVGIIGGNTCRLMSYSNIERDSAAYLVCQMFAGQRDVLIMNADTRPDVDLEIIGVERLLCLQKGTES
jgi:lipopolysaccharide/colanic/teichoic acid biosynthesis glycosyltransferase/ribosomal protein S18 acetylase RimI-like enzyme